MGLFKKLFGAVTPGKAKVRILCVGLDNSGKSTIINWLKPKKVRSKEPHAPRPCRARSHPRRVPAAWKWYGTAKRERRSSGRQHLPKSCRQLASASRSSQRTASRSQYSTCRGRDGTGICGSTTTRRWAPRARRTAVLRGKPSAHRYCSRPRCTVQSCTRHVCRRLAGGGHHLLHRLDRSDPHVRGEGRA